MSTVPSLIADIGGTNARFALADKNGITESRTLLCAEYPTLVDAVRAYLNGVGVKPKRAAFAIAGPVTGDYFKMTNHHWEFSIEETRKILGLDHFELMNDFKAIAYGVPHLKADDFKQIGGNQKSQPEMPIGIIGPGTGLGVASLVWVNGRYHPLAGEGGNVTMGARNQRELDLMNHLRRTYRHISAERVCSGKGLMNLYSAIAALDGHSVPERTAEEISQAALNKSCAVCVEALDRMMGFLGVAAGNLALTIGAHGGVYIAGGIPAKLGEYFENSPFRGEFEAKGRYEAYMKEIPTYLITHPNIAFVGLQHVVSA